MQRSPGPASGQDTPPAGRAESGLRLDEVRAAVTRAEANVKLAESQNSLAQTTAQRYAELAERLLVTPAAARRPRR